MVSSQGKTCIRHGFQQYAEKSDRPMTSQDELDLLAALKNGDEQAFEALITAHHAALLKTARLYVHDWHTAEEVVQDTWVGVLKGLERFEGRSSLKTWIFSILVNRASTRAQREGRYLPIMLDDDEEPTVAAERFHPSGHSRAGHWSVFPDGWENIPEERLLSAEVRGLIDQAIQALPANQQLVVRLRDIEQLPAKNVSQMLEITEVNQRVLLHRARARIRQVLEAYFAE